jgi:endonuclease I
MAFWAPPDQGLGHIGRATFYLTYQYLKLQVG